MDIMEVMRARRSVRSFTDQPLSANERQALEEVLAKGNAKGGLDMRLVCDEPEAFNSTLAHYGRFSGVRNYIVLAGPDAPNLNERCGYYGEQAVLTAQQLGLGTCWVALTFKKRFVKKLIGPGEKLALVIAVGHGTTTGQSHKVKEAAEVSKVAGGGAAPAWFARGVAAALTAPTAMNQQKFELVLEEGKAADGRPVVGLRSLGGAYSDVDLGIVRLHFELGAGTHNFAWATPL